MTPGLSWNFPGSGRPGGVNGCGASPEGKDKEEATRLADLLEKDALFDAVPREATPTCAPNVVRFRFTGAGAYGIPPSQVLLLHVYLFLSSSCRGSHHGPPCCFSDACPTFQPLVLSGTIFFPKQRCNRFPTLFPPRVFAPPLLPPTFPAFSR